MRARDLGITIGKGAPGPNNAITDVEGVRVGHTTLVRGDGPLVVGRGPVRTGVTMVVPCDDVGTAPVFAGCHRLNGNGELTGLEWVRESGLLTTPIGITNTHSVGVVRDALVAADVARPDAGSVYWSLPVVGETWDGYLNDIGGMHVKSEHAHEALANASGGAVTEGNVGGGTGMICHDFKGGIGTSSRLLPPEVGGYRVGVLVQANQGRRERLRVDGVPVGEAIPFEEAPEPTHEPGGPGVGSIIIVVATDAPLLPHQCDRLAQRAGFGVARTGGVGEHTSGDLFVCFATGNRGRLSNYKVGDAPITIEVIMLSDLVITHLYDAVVEATEEAIVNAVLAAETMVGRDGITAYALDPDRLIEVMREFGRGPEVATTRA
jgi:D-aminopeptidase